MKMAAALDTPAINPTLQKSNIKMSTLKLSRLKKCVGGVLVTKGWRCETELLVGRIFCQSAVDTALSIQLQV